MKKLAKKAVAAVLGYQIRRLYKKNNFMVIAVVGSIGKTSTKLAVANVLKQGFKVQYQEGNYNDLVSVPLVFFGQELPSLFNPLAWLGVFWRNQKQLKQKYPYDLVVLELGSDAPGQIKEFKKYLNLEVAIITAITPEHMEFFGTLDEVANEELTVSEMSSLVLANKDLCNQNYLANLSDVLTYSIKSAADYRLNIKDNDLIVNAGEEVLADTSGIQRTEPELYSLLAAAAVAYKLGMTPADIKKGIQNIKPVPGRMQRLAGIKNSTIIDDSYNASPTAVELALDSLYRMKAPQKIAVLGNMNELGNYSQKAHKEIGDYCDSKQLDLVVTIGRDANKFLAAEAEAKGCKVERFDSPYKAGEYLKDYIKEKAAVLVKGSQNGVFAEETIKLILADPQDSSKLVRQTSGWLSKKEKMFNQ